MPDQLTLVTDAEAVQPAVYAREPRAKAYARSLQRSRGGASWWLVGDDQVEPETITVHFNTYARPGQTREEARQAGIDLLAAVQWVTVPGGYRLLHGARLVSYTPTVDGWRFTAALLPQDPTIYQTTTAIAGFGNGTGAATAFVLRFSGPITGSGNGTGFAQAAVEGFTFSGVITGSGTGTGTATGNVIEMYARVDSAIVGTHKAG